MIYRNFFQKISLLLFLLFFSGFSFAGVVILNGLTHEKQVLPGESYKGIIEIQNTAGSEQNVKIYLRDYWYSFNGESKHPEAGTMERSNANWIKFNPELLVLGPNEKASIDFEVNVPVSDTLSGTFWSVLMVEGINPPDTTDNSKGVTINTAIRYAVQVITNIGNTGTRDIKFLGLDLARQDENNMLNVFIENTGERVLRPELALELFGESGNSTGVLKAERRKIYPGTSVKITLILEGIKPGKYTGVLVADCDEDHVFGTNVSFEVN